MYIQKDATLASRPALIQIKVPSGFGTTQIRGFYRGISAGSYTGQLMQQQGNTFSLWVPASATASGIQYYMQAENSNGTVLATLPETNPAAQPFTLPATSSLQQAVQANSRNAFEFATGLTFEIPSGALAQNTNLRVSALSTSPVAPSGIITTNIGYNFSMADGTTSFSKPISITFNYASSDVSGLDASQLRVYYMDNGALKLAGGVVNTTTQAISVTVNHFSDFIIAQGRAMYPAPVARAQAGTTVTIQASVVNFVPVQSATLYYKPGADGWKSLAMPKIGQTHQATIPALDVTLAGLAYYIQASDGSTTATYPATNPTISPQIITVVQQTTNIYLPFIVRNFGTTDNKPTNIYLPFIVHNSGTASNRLQTVATPMTTASGVQAPKRTITQTSASSRTIVATQTPTATVIPTKAITPTLTITPMIKPTSALTRITATTLTPANMPTLQRTPSPASTPTAVRTATPTSISSSTIAPSSTPAQSTPTRTLTSR
jgi:hypothetical protein